MNMLKCHACGKRFRSMSAEAKHRHNFPALCNKTSKQWDKFRLELAEDQVSRLTEQLKLADDLAKAVGKVRRGPVGVPGYLSEAYARFAKTRGMIE